MCFIKSPSQGWVERGNKGYDWNKMSWDRLFCCVPLSRGCGGGGCEAQNIVSTSTSNLFADDQHIKTRSGFVCLENCGQCKRHVILVDSLEIVVISCTYGQFFRYFLLLQRRSSSYSINKLIKKRLKELSPSFADGPAGGPRPGEQEWQQGVGEPRSQGDHES